MVTSELALLLLPAVLACLIAGMAWTRRHWGESGRHLQDQLPPAPPGWWPFIGHLHLLGSLPHQALAKLARRHGPSLMSVRLGSVLAVVASTPEAAQLFLQTHDDTFASRPRTAATFHLAFNSSDILTSPPNAFWRRMRQLCTSDLFSNKRIHSFQPIRSTGIQSLLSAIYDNRDRAMQLRPALLATMLDTIAKMTIGRTLSRHATDLICELVHLLGVLNLGDCIPLVACLDLQGYERRMKLVGQQWGCLLQEVLDERRKHRASEGSGGTSAMATDLLDVLLSVPDMSDRGR